MSAIREAMSHAVLGWVKPELDETLRLARGEIEAFVETPADTSRMRFCVGYLHQVQGTLRMVELYAPAMVAEELELLALALQEGGVADRDEACATLMRGAVLLPDYLERLQDGHRDIPIVLLPLLNEIRSARGAPVLNESMLFPPGSDAESAPQPSAEEIDHARSSISGRNRELLDTVGNAVKEELLRVKDALDLHLRARDNPGSLQPQVAELGNVADTLGMMGLGVARDVVLQQRDALREVAEGRRQADEGTLLDIAGALLYVDASLDDQVARLGGPGSDAGRDASASESQRTVEVLAQEAIINFGAAREKFVAFIETNWNHDQLVDVPRLLDEVAGAMRMLELSQAGDYVTGVRRYVNNELIGKRRIPGGQQLDTLADALASLEYYLEALRERRPNREDILEITRSSLENLRYWPLPADAPPPPAEVAATVAAPAVAVVNEAVTSEVSAPAAANPFDPVGFEFAEDNVPVAQTQDVPVAWEALEIAEDAPAAAFDSPAVDAPVSDVPAVEASEFDEAAAVLADIQAAAASLTIEQDSAPVAAPQLAEAVAEAPRAPSGAISPMAGGFDGDAGDIDDEIREVFLEEFDEEIVNLRQLLPSWRNAPDDLERLRPIRRVFHTLKGSGRLVGAKTLGEFSWKIENMLNRVLDRTRPPSTAVAVLLEQTCDVLPQLNAALRGEAPVSADLEGLKAIADRVAAGEEAFYAASADAAGPADEASLVVADELQVEEVSADVLDVPELAIAEEGTPASVDAVLREILEAEVATHLDTVNGWLAASRVVAQPASEPLLRAVHTMNGAFAMADVPEIIEVTAPAEQYIKRLLAASATPSQEGIVALAHTASAIARSVEALKQPSPRIPAFAELSARLAALRDGLPDARAAAQTINDASQTTYASTSVAAADGMALADLQLAPHDLSAFLDGDVAGTPGSRELYQEVVAHSPQEPSVRDPSEYMDVIVHEIVGEETNLAVPPAEAVPGGVTYFDVAYNYSMRPREDAHAAADAGHALETADAVATLDEASSDDSALTVSGEWDVEAITLEGEAGIGETVEVIELAEIADSSELAHIAESDEAQPQTLSISELTDGDDANALAETGLEAAFTVEDAAAVDAVGDELVVEEVTLEGDALSTDAAAEAEAEAEAVVESVDALTAVDASDLAPADEALPVQNELTAAEVEAEFAAPAEAEVVETETQAVEVVQASDDQELVVDAPLQDVVEDIAAEPEALALETVEGASADATLEAEEVAVVSAVPAEDQPEDALDVTGLDLDLVEIFIEEGNDLLDHSDDLLAKLRETPEDRTLVTSLQRDLHTLKGGARMAGIHAVGDLGHAIESMLESIVAQRTELDRRGIGLLERGFDALHDQLKRVSARRTVQVPDGMIAEFNAHARGIELPERAEVVPEEPKAPVNLAPLSAPVETEFTQQDEEFFPHSQQEQVRVRADLLDRLVNHAGEVAIYRARLEQQLGAFRGAMGELERTNIRLHDQLRRLDLETEAQIVARYQREHDRPDTTFDPLELDRFSTLQQLSRALAESAADISGLQGVLDDLARNYDSLLHQQSRVSSELQDGLMRARMVPFEGIVPRLRRVLRQAASDTGKQVALKLDGTHGELDRNVLERMTAPLEHLLRNSVAHGLEAPDKRKAAGKPEEGTVQVSLRREGSEMVLHVTDDGAGLNRAAIRKRAEARGLLQAGQAIDDIDLDRLILESGFSTYDSVSQLAGRGVGMDVVYNEVRQLGGTLDIVSRPSEGAQFILRLPQTLAVTQAAFVQIGETQFAVPVASVSGIGRISRERFEASGGSYVYGGEEYALYNLGDLVGHAPARAEGQAQVPLLLIRAGDMRAAVAVDQVLGNREIVVKPVGPQIASIPGIYGATITGDGSVVVILDIAPLVRRHLAQPAQPATSTAAAAERRVPLVMVVDDSLTMRKVTSRVLERHNLEVTAARDGVEALERLEERVPDLMLLDIEMPRMDGYELATAMKADARFRDVPIVMITSRTGDKHRQRAFDIGVQRYMGKPYQELDLMRNVYDLLGMARVRE